MGEIDAVVGGGDLEGASQFAGAGKIGLPLVERFGGRGSGRRNERNQDSPATILSILIHAVDTEINVGVAGRAKHDFGAFSAAFGGVGGKIGSMGLK